MKTYEKVNLKSLKETIAKLKPNEQELANTLYKEVDFMQDTLDTLKEDITKKGIITKMDQGKYTIDRANPSLQQYNTLIKNYATCIKQLKELIKEASSDIFGIDDIDLSLDDYIN